MEHLLSKVTKDDVRLDPFPHIIIRDPVSPEMCNALLQQYPSLETITKGAPYVSNQRFSYSASDVLAQKKATQAWADFVSAHLGREFWLKFVELFGEEVIRLAPWLAADPEALKHTRLGVRNINDHESADVVLDAQICINTPVTEKASSVKMAHLDNEHELFAGLWYLRPRDDDSRGGDLELYRYKPGKPAFHGPRLVDKRYVEKVASIRYENNVLVLFLNTFHALHGVTAREVTNRPRYLFNILGEVKKPLFDLKPYKENIFRRILRRTGI